MLGGASYFDHFITSIQWNNTGEKVVTSASDGVARVWNDRGDIQCIYRAGQDYLMSMGVINNLSLASKWNKEGQLIASGGTDKQILVW
mmetsp:Transcript_42051/g.40319  ORF Transcript_42051/g.40319 Transcript_42051/m.40319 type:complete len:88 (+) Transcript_42051:866-1129(+)